MAQRQAKAVLVLIFCLVQKVLVTRKRHWCWSWPRKCWFWSWSWKKTCLGQWQDAE